jgi:hypothetical protein
MIAEYLRVDGSGTIEYKHEGNFLSKKETATLNITINFKAMFMNFLRLQEKLHISTNTTNLLQELIWQDKLSLVFPLKNKSSCSIL